MISLLPNMLMRPTECSLIAHCVTIFGAIAIAAEDAASQSSDKASKPEKITLKAAIDDGPVVLVNQANVVGPSRVDVM